MTVYSKNTDQRWSQGDILRDVSMVLWAEQIEDSLEVREHNLGYCVVLSQDCDLLHDYNSRANPQPKDHDKFLQSILVCPAYPADSLWEGSHLKEQKFVMQRINSDEKKRVKQNNAYRYHYLNSDLNLQIPELVIDFKHYFTIPRDIVYRNNFRSCYLATIGDLFREHLSQRFATFLSRIGLPEPVTN